MTSSERPTSDAARLAHTVANMRQGESGTPRCEPPGEADVQIARTWVDRVLRAQAMLSSAPASPAIGIQVVTDEMVERFMTAMFGSYNELTNFHTWVSPSWPTTTQKVRAALEAALHPAPEAASAGGAGEPFQNRVQPWMLACFGPEISGDRVERGDRLLEEVFELLQSGGYDPARVLALRDYVWGREKGEPVQEVGGVMVTLAAYCLAHELDMHEAGETELARIWTKVEKIRAKQAAKPVGSALPVAPSDTAPSPKGASDGVREAARFLLDRLDEFIRDADDLPSVTHGWFGHVEPAIKRLEAALSQEHAPKVSDGVRFGYVEAFYEIASMLGIPPQNRTPQEVWATVMRPMLVERLGVSE